MKGSRDNQKQIAQDLYLNTTYAQKEICELVDVTEKTFIKWKIDGQWDLLKGALSTTPNQILANLYKRAKELSEAPEVNADAIVKISSAIEKLKPTKATISNHINTFREFTTFLLKVNPELAQIVNSHQKLFIDEQINNY